MELVKIELTEQQTKDYYNFCEEHKDCCQKYLNKPFFSTIGGQFTINITPTGLGDTIIVTCNACKITKDITDTSNW